jgi:hypothetical protein
VYSSHLKLRTIRDLAIFYPLDEYPNTEAL